jgi:hypothetical protein
MFQALALVFGNAAPPQKIALIMLFGAIPFTLLAAALAFRKDVQGRKWRRVVEDLRLVGPALGLLLGALNSFHMGQTIQRLPFDPTAKQLAPGILEVSTFIWVGALVGLVAVAAHRLLSLAAGERAS